MAKINLIGYFRPYECTSEWTDNFIPPDRHEYNYRFRLLLNVVSEVGSTQVRVYSLETRDAEWPDNDLLFAFNKVYVYLKRMVEQDKEINIFDEIQVFIGTEKIKDREMQIEFTIEIPEGKENHKKLTDSLSQVKKAQELFEKCKDKLFTVIGWGNPSLEINYYSILKVINYVASVINAAVVNTKNSEYLSNIRSAFAELKKRTITQNYNYQTILTLAKQDIYSLEFPKYFKSNLPYNNDIGQVLDDIR